MSKIVIEIIIECHYKSKTNNWLTQLISAIICIKKEAKKKCVKIGIELFSPRVDERF